MTEEQMSFPEPDGRDEDDFDPEYYEHLAEHPKGSKGYIPLFDSPGHLRGHAVIPDTESEAAEKSTRGTKQVSERMYALRYLYDAGLRGATCAECNDSNPTLYAKSRNQAAISFQWMRQAGWARRVLASARKRPLQPDDLINTAKTHVVRKTSEPSSTGKVHVLTTQGREEFAERFPQE